MNRHNIVPFGTTPVGEAVHKIHLQNQDLSCDILTYGARNGFCLETQFYPDAIHHESFPSPILEAGKVYTHSTVFSFNNI